MFTKFWYNENSRWFRSLIRFVAYHASFMFREEVVYDHSELVGGWYSAIRTFPISHLTVFKDIYGKICWGW